MAMGLRRTNWSRSLKTKAPEGALAEGAAMMRRGLYT
jgi:hypothetical protein